MAYNKTLLSTLLVGAMVSSSSFAADDVTYSQSFGAELLPTPQVQEDFNKGSWSLVQFNDAPDSADILQLLSLLVDRSDFATGQVVNGAIDGQIHFETIWTRSTLKAMLGLDNFKALRQDYTVKEIRTAVNDVCAPVLELGTAATYGAPYNIKSNEVNYIAELDSDSKHCTGRSVTVGTAAPLPILGGNPANVRIRSFVPTVPGATYSMDVEFQKRSTNSRDVGDLIVRVGGEVMSVAGVDGIDWDTGDQRAVFPTTPAVVDINELEHGFFKGTVTFKATRFFTPINLRDNGIPDSYGVLVDDVTVTQTQPNELYDWCSMLFKAQSKNLKLCLQGNDESSDNFFSCDFDNLIGRNVKIKRKTEGGHSPELIQNLTGDQGSSTFFRMGLNARVTIPMAGRGCPIYNNTLALNEFTNNYPAETFSDYPEQGTVTAVLRCYDANEDSMYTRNVVLNKVEEVDLTSGITPDDDETLLRTNQEIFYTFDGDEDKSCRLVKVRIKDKTPRISPTSISHDGIDIQGLRIIVNE
ncbi:hypothetical protein [Vibrio hippocampi]|uniref:Hemolysin n=1 Tax=Vibrio hippocampi TaxID=654686 RepID=A0ABN8DHB5_9VIBR|nr:hypothetical protein [Vibrio hippocampi]CAH0526075.1 hypothetical protein VHP8226_01561 [Vibrio hippocampi]